MRKRNHAKPPSQHYQHYSETRRECERRRQTIQEQQIPRVRRQKANGKGARQRASAHEEEEKQQGDRIAMKPEAKGGFARRRGGETALTGEVRIEAVKRGPDSDE